MPRLTGLVLALGGLTLALALIVWQGIGTIVQLFQAAGWALLLFGPFYLIPICLAAASWGQLIDRSIRPPLARLIYASWIGLSVNWLLSVAQIGGEFAKARIITDSDVGPEWVIASVTVDKLIQATTQALYAVIGIGLFVAYLTDSQIVISAAIFVGLLSAGIYGFYRIQRRGLFVITATGAARLAGRFFPAHLSAKAERIDMEVKSIYGRRAMLFTSTTFRLAFRFVLAGEIYIAMLLFGQPASLMDALMLESLVQAVRGMAFAVPGALGVQEGGFVVLGLAVGLSPELALSIALCKRVRELLVGVPGLLAWHIAESRGLVKRIPRVSGSSK